MRIQIPLFYAEAEQDPTFYADAEQDPAFYANPYPYPTFDADQDLESNNYLIDKKHRY